MRLNFFLNSNCYTYFAGFYSTRQQEFLPATFYFFIVLSWLTINFTILTRSMYYMVLIMTQIFIYK